MTFARLGKIKKYLSELNQISTANHFLEKKLIHLIQNSKEKWQWYLNNTIILVAGCYVTELKLLENATVVKIGKYVSNDEKDERFKYLELPTVQLSPSIWFLAYDRAMKDRGKETLSDIFERLEEAPGKESDDNV